MGLYRYQIAPFGVRSLEAAMNTESHVQLLIDKLKFVTTGPVPDRFRTITGLLADALV